MINRHVLALLAGVCLLASPWSQADGFKAGIEIKAEASMREIGLPIYPGARPQIDREGDEPAVSMGLWGGMFGFKLQVNKFQSADDVEAVAAYYREAMAKHGTVLDCSAPPAKAVRINKDSKDDKDDDNRLSCKDDKPEAGGRLYKVGSKKNFRVVAIKPVATGVHFQVLRITLGGA